MTSKDVKFVHENTDMTVTKAKANSANLTESKNCNALFIISK